MALFRRSVSKKLPDHLLVISDRVYVFDYCLSTDYAMSSKDYKAYMDSIVTNLHNYHPGASFMVFNFKEGDQRSRLSDILTDHDMTVVDYPLHFAGYALLPVEVIYYFLRSSESWLSLEAQQNAILMHCERGGWPVLAFMLSALLLYRRKNTDEQHTLEMMYDYKQGYYKQHVSLLYPVGPQPSQIRYLRYISRRNMSSDSFPSDAPLVIECLVIWNLPLLDGAKGCRPIVHIYGQDAFSKPDGSPGLLFSSIGREETTHYFPEEEPALVKLDIGCQVQGDVLLECFHLSDDLVSEETLFRAMFHTGFIQSNILTLSMDEIDVYGNEKVQLPKDFKVEVIFSNDNQVPSGEKGHESDNEFFEVEEIFSNLVESPELTEDTCTAQDDLVEDHDRKKELEEIFDTSSQEECNVDSGAPEHESDVNSLKESALDIESPEQASKVESDVSSSVKPVPNSEIHEQALKVETEGDSSKESVLNIESHEQASEVESDVNSSRKLVPDTESREQALKVESDVESSKDFALDIESHEQASTVESDVSSCRKLVPDTDSHEQALKAESDVESSKDFGPCNQSREQNSGAELDRISLKEFAPDDEGDEQALKVESDVESSKDFAPWNQSHGQASGAELDGVSWKEFALDHEGDEQALKVESDVESSKDFAPWNQSHGQASGAELDGISWKEFALDNDSDEQALKVESDVESSKDFAPWNQSYGQASGAELDGISWKEFALDNDGNEQALKVESKGKDASSSLKTRSIVVVDGSQEQQVKVEHGPRPITEKQKTKEPKLKDAINKLTMQQRVVTRWVPRNKEAAAPDATKPKPAVFRWVPKGSASADVKPEVASS